MGRTGRGIVFGFNAHTLTRMPHMQALHVEFLPFALLAFDRLLVDPRARHAVSFAAWFVLQALASFYLLVITSVGFAAALRPSAPEAWRGKARAEAGRLPRCWRAWCRSWCWCRTCCRIWSLSHGGFGGRSRKSPGSWRTGATTSRRPAGCRGCSSRTG